MNCKNLEEKLPLYLYDELEAKERTTLDAHLASCPHCRAAVEEIRRLHQVLAQRSAPELSPKALVECRQALVQALDRDPNAPGWKGLFRRWTAVLSASPALLTAAGLALVVVSFNVGWRLRSRAGGVKPGSQNISSASFLPSDFGDMRISEITRVVPDPRTGDVRITLDAERRVTLEGPLDDPRIQQVLLYAVKTYNNPGIRRDTLDALQPRANNPNVREVLLYAMEHDPNPGVRLEALEAVRGLEWGPDVRRAFLSVLERDTNPGLRVAAIDVLVAHADEAVLPAFERLASKDSNRYVRLKCASAIRDLKNGDD